MKPATLWTPLLLFWAAPTFSLPSAPEHSAQGHSTPGHSALENNRSPTVAHPPAQQLGLANYVDLATASVPWLISAVLAVALARQQGQISKLINIQTNYLQGAEDKQKTLDAANNKAMQAQNAVLEAQGKTVALYEEVNRLQSELIRSQNDRQELSKQVERLRKKVAQKSSGGAGIDILSQRKAALDSLERRIVQLQHTLHGLGVKAGSLFSNSPEENFNECVQEQTDIEGMKSHGEKASQKLLNARKNIGNFCRSVVKVVFEGTTAAEVEELLRKTAHPPMSSSSSVPPELETQGPPQEKEGLNSLKPVPPLPGAGDFNSRDERQKVDEEVDATVQQILDRTNMMSVGLPAAAVGAQRRVSQLPQQGLAALGSARDAVTSYLRTSTTNRPRSRPGGNRGNNNNNNFFFSGAGGLPYMPYAPSNRGAAASPFAMGRFMRIGRP